MMIQVASQQVELASLVEACKRRQLLSRRSVTPQVVPLGDHFTIGEESWNGLAILSPDALFLLKLTRAGQLPHPSRPSEANLDLCPKPLLTVHYTQLPLPITDDEGWPKPPSIDCEVAILLRDEARQVRAVPFTREVEFLSESPRIRVACSRTAAGIAASRLKDSGWIRTTDAARGPAPQPSPAFHVFERRDRRPYLIAAGVLTFLLITFLAVQFDSLNTQMAMLLCIPVLALLGYALVRLMSAWGPGKPSDPQ